MTSAQASDPARIVVLGAAGGEGATTVSRLVADAMIETRRPVVMASRADDRMPAALTAALAGTIVADPGPHGVDGTTRPGDVAVHVCAATTAAIERARALLVEADAQEHRAAALVICARSRKEGRRARVRMEQVARTESRVVLLPYDAALARSPHPAREYSPATRAAVRSLLALLAHEPAHAP